MASLIPGYNYDIFISYRQKDNKGDRWVSEFVEALKTELESTFKEDINVYFDINPHDGLLETHDVDASLKDKLKCLVFIPIISRTYCDPNAFAWEHEFKAFIEQASKDQFGLKVKLPNGNVANRVLPVLIHDLDNEDIKICESILGGVIRGIEFIYKEPGVNRPLSPADDEKVNLNKTKYRNQINKAANAIKEIITGLRNPDREGKEISKGIYEEKFLVRKNLRTKIIVGSLILLALIVAGYFIIPKLLKPTEQLEKSIAVLPFKLLSDEPDKQYLADGMMDAILLHLSKIEDLHVMSRTSTEQYRNPDKTMPEIGRELGVGYLLEGSFQKSGDNVRLIVQLIKASKDDHIWSNEYDRNWNDIFSVQSEVAQSIARELNAVITPEEKLTIEKIPTANLSAYDFYQRGREEHSKYSQNNQAALEKAKNLYNKALEYDPRFAQAYIGLARVYWDKHYWSEYFSQNYMDSVLILADIALSFDDKLAEAYTLRGEYYRAIGNRDEAIKEYDKANKFNPNDWTAYRGKGFLYLLDDFVKAIDNLQKAAFLNHGNELPDLLRNLSWAYISIGFADKSIYCLQEALKLDGDSLAYYYPLARLQLFSDNNIEKCIESCEKAYLIDSNNIDVLGGLGTVHMYLGQYERALKYSKKSFERLKAIGNLDTDEMHRIGYAYWMNGYKEEAEYYFDKQIEYCNRMNELHRFSVQEFFTYYNLAGVYAFRGEKDKAYENLRIFNQKKRMPLWMVWYIKNDPLFNSIRNEPEFQQIVKDVEAKYQAEHERVRKWLEEQGML